MRRIFSVVMVVCLMFTAIAGTGIVASAIDPEMIDSVTLEDVPVAEAGKTITAPQILPEDDSYDVFAEWVDADYNPASGCFEDGKLYYLIITLTAADGYEFNEYGIDVYIDGYHYYAEPTDTGEYIAEVRNSLLPKIDKVEITGVTEAKIGEVATVDGITVPDGANYYIDYAAWFDYRTGDDVTGNTFEDKKKYELNITVAVDDTKYDFADNVVITVNGKRPEFAFNDISYVDVFLDYSFLESIDKIELPAFLEAEIGDAAVFSDDPVVENDKYTVYADWTVYNTEDDTWEGFEDTFEDGMMYKYTYYISVGDGFAITDETEILVGGKQVNSIYNFVYEDFSMISKMYNFSDLQEIKTVEITVPEPEINADIDPDAITIPEDAEYTLDYFSWGVSADGNIIHAEEAEGKFKEGEYYHIIAGIFANEGYIFAEDLVITVNGKPIDIRITLEMMMDMQLVTPTSVIVPYTFGKLTKEEIITPPGNKVPGNTDKTPQSPLDETPSSIPKAGDNSLPVVMTMAVVLISVMALGAVVLMKKKQSC